MKMAEEFGDHEPGSVHPEVKADVEAAIPALDESKRAVVNLILEKLKNTAPDEQYVMEQFDDPATGDVVNVTLNTDPIEQESQILVTVSESKENYPDLLQTHYSFNITSDGLQIEKHTYVEGGELFAKMGSGQETAFKEVDDDEEDEKDDDHFERLEKAKEEERELGLLLFTERDALNLKSLLERIVPYPPNKFIKGKRSSEGN